MLCSLTSFIPYKTIFKERSGSILGCRLRPDPDSGCLPRLLWLKLAAEDIFLTSFEKLYIYIIHLLLYHLQLCFCDIVTVRVVEYSRLYPSILLVWWRWLGCSSWQTSDSLYMFYCWRLLYNEPRLISFHTRLCWRGQFHLCLSLLVRKHFT